MISRIHRPIAATMAGLAASCLVLAQPPDQRAGSPAASPVPETLREQSYSAELVEAGGLQFASQCGFCHGLDAGGGSGGPDLTRSELVARDYRGDEIAPVIRNGRLEAAVPMPAFPDLAVRDLDAIVAFIHDRKARAESAEGGRRAVSAEDVQSGEVAAGRRYFERECTDCHSADVDLRGIASRVDGLNLMRLMLNPRLGRGPSTRATPRAEVTTRAGETFVGFVAFEDEFAVALTDADGRYRSFPKRAVELRIEDPLARHFELLDEFTDEDMHDVLTYLHTLR